MGPDYYFSNYWVNRGDAMNNMKCPFCNRELHKDSNGYYTCYTDNCGCWANGGNGASGSKSLWLTLICTRKALDVAVDALKYANKCIKGGCVNWETEIDKALDKITALEQKDVK